MDFILPQRKRRLVRAAWCFLAVLVLAGCRREAEPEPAAPLPPPAASELPPYARYLAGVRICLDPGHGGRAARPGYKRGPTGLREAEVNLRVALLLRDYLKTAGAKVFMTRTTDVYLHADEHEDLRRRADLANRNDCDIFLSIHHNASDRETANFSSVWYHGDVDQRRPSLDVARHLAVALVDELPLPEHLACPVLSDHLMYPRGGFAVLRHARVPAAVLSEASFHSNPEEEQRLRDPEYNRREARALFIGLTRYAYGGIPRARLIEPADGTLRAGGARKVIIELDDGISSRKGWGWDRRLIPRDSIAVRIGRRELPFQLSEQPDRLSIELPGDLPAGPVSVDVQFQNLFAHANTRPAILLKIER